MNQQVDKGNLGEGSIGKHLFRLSLPAITAQVVNVLYNMVDRVYVGRIPGTGAQALTGLGVCMPLIMIVSAFAALAGMGGAPRAAIKMGADSNDEAEKILGNCTMLLGLLGLVLTAVLLIFARPMLMLFGASEATIEYAVSYMRIYAIGSLFVLLTIGLNAFVSAQGFANISMATVLIGAVANIILDPIFIFVFNMGVAGAAWATILSQALSAVFVLRFLTGPKTTLRIQKRYLRLSPKVVLPCIALGLAPFIMQSTEGLITICFNTSLQRFGGDLAVGSMTILSTLMQFSILPLMGLTQGAQPIISFNYGAKNAHRVRATFRLSVIAGFLYTLLVWAGAMFLPRVFVGIFTTDQALIDYAAWALCIYMAASLLLGLQVVCQQTFIAIGNAKTSVFLAVLRKILLLLPLMYLLPVLLPDNKVMAVFLAEPVADVIAVATTVLMFSKQFKHAMHELELSSRKAA